MVSRYRLFLRIEQTMTDFTSKKDFSGGNGCPRMYSLPDPMPAACMTLDFFFLAYFNLTK